MTDGVLREDLYYRLNVIPIDLPPLRERTDDIPILVAHFIGRIAKDVGKTIAGIAPEALGVLERYHWPGNIRELENVIERAIVLGSGEQITPDSLPRHLAQPSEPGEFPVDIPAGGMDLEGLLAAVESRYIRLALDRAGGLQVRAAELLRLSFRQFRYKLQKYGLRGRGHPAPKSDSAN
jgi:DNA-binding NtrC family response regulator